MYEYRIIAIAGTFDRLHKGHRFFIGEAFKFGERVIIGLTSKKYVEEKRKAKSEKLKTNVNNYETRKRELEEFLTAEKILERAEIVKIDDLYGPAIERTDIQALAVTSETIKGGRLVNRKRLELGLKGLELVQIPLVKADDRDRIASTRIRLGEIDRYGKVFGKVMPFGKISEGLRQELKKPIGYLLKGDPDNLSGVSLELKKRIREIRPVMISTVGDEVTRLCNKIGIPVNLAIFDYKVKRVKIYNSLSDLGFATSDNILYTIRNPAGCITQTLVDGVRRSIKDIVRDGKTRLIKILGEDDLAGVPAILLSPLGSSVLYGQPTFVPSSGTSAGKSQEGIVLVEVTENIKQTLLDLMRKS